MNFVKPQVALIGYTQIDYQNLNLYLMQTGNKAFFDAMLQAKGVGISEGEMLCSFYAKLCYKSLSVGHNSNITRTRDIEDNIKGCFDVGHGSVFEHCNLNFIAWNVSRVFTHELVRHRVGSAYSQTSGRYCRLDSIDFVSDPLLDSVEGRIADHLRATEDLVFELECKLGLRKKNVDGVWVNNDGMPFDQRKKITSAIRRIAPNGQANEIGFTLNIRSLRHMVEVRTSRHAEREIRQVFARVYELVNAKFPLIFYGSKTEVIDGVVEVSGMKHQPYQEGE